jgi:hypothetical protein
MANSRNKISKLHIISPGLTVIPFLFQNTPTKNSTKTTMIQEINIKTIPEGTARPG